MTPFLSFLGPPALAAALAYALTPIAAKLAVRIGAVDHPGVRKIHNRSVPRLGGASVIVAIAGAWTASWALSLVPGLSPAFVMGLTIGLVPIVTISVFDDIRPLPAGRKFLAHLAGATIAVAFGISLGPSVEFLGVTIPLDFFAGPLSILWIIGVTSAFNLIDGLDGLSAGLALIAATGLAAVFLLTGHPDMAIVALILAGALLGFLPFNLHPAKLFLGDTGATAIGFFLALLTLEGGASLSSGFAVLIPVFILGLPIADTLVSIARRSLSRLERKSAGVLTPDRNHIHHRLLSLGLGHRRTVLTLYAVGVGAAAAALVSMFLDVQETAFFLAAALLAGLIGIQRLGYDEFALLRRGLVLNVFDFPIVRRSMFQVFVDVAITLAASYAAIGLTRDSGGFSAVHPAALSLASTFAPITILVFWKSGLYRGSWRFAGISELLRLTKSVGFVFFAGVLVHKVLWADALSTNILIVFGLLTLVLTASSRALYVVLRSVHRRAVLYGAPTLVYGAGAYGARSVDTLFGHSALGFRPVGFIDDDTARSGQFVNGLRILGPVRRLERIIREKGAEAVLIASSNIGPKRLEQAVTACRETGAQLLRLGPVLNQLDDDDDDDDDRIEAVDWAGSPNPPRWPPPDAVSIQDVSVKAPTAAGSSCGDCGSPRVFRSRNRGPVDRLRKLVTKTRLHRCHACGRHTWARLGRTPSLQTSGSFDQKTPNFERLDDLVQRARLQAIQLHDAPRQHDNDGHYDTIRANTVSSGER